MEEIHTVFVGGAKEEAEYQRAKQTLKDCELLGESRLPLAGDCLDVVNLIDAWIDQRVFLHNGFRMAYEKGWASNV